MPTTQLPPRPMPGGPGRDRTVRRVLVILALACIVLSLGGLAVRSIASGIEQSRFDEVPSVLGAGTPAELTVSTSVSDVTVRVSDEVEETTLALVESGTQGVPADPDPVRARWTRTGDQDSMRIEVRRPHLGSPADWFDGEDRELLIEVPADSAGGLALTVRTDVGDIAAEGAFGSLDLGSSTGSIEADGVSTSGSLIARTQIGDLDLALGDEGAGDVSARADVGDVDVALPCCESWQVDARSEEGEQDVAPGIRGEGRSVTARTDVGDVSVSRR